MFVSDTMRGELYKVTPPATKGGAYTKQTWLKAGTFANLLGCTLDPAADGTVFVVGRLASNRSTVVIAVNTAQPESWRLVVQLPAATIGNGFRMDLTSKLLYTSSEGNWLPEGGAVYEINATRGSYVKIDAPWAADGLWIDQNRRELIVGQLFAGNLFVYDLRRGGAPKLGASPGISGLIDDFCLDYRVQPQTVLACNFLGARIERFATNLNGSSPNTTVVISGHGLQTPTSIRWGRGGGFATTSLFVTEGGGVLPWTTSRRVLEYVDAASWLGVDRLVEPLVPYDAHEAMTLHLLQQTKNKT
jgi:hypothetical protein